MSFTVSSASRRVASPVIDLSLFSRRAFTCGGLVVALGNMAMYAFLFELPGFFARARAQGAGATGRAMLGMMLGMVVFSPLGARLSERVGPRLAAALGLILCGVGVYLLGDAARLMTPSDALPALVLMGMGLGLSSSPAQAASIASVPREQAGMAAGVTATMRYLGGIAGIAVLGALGGVVGTTTGVFAILTVQDRLSAPQQVPYTEFRQQVAAPAG